MRTVPNDVTAIMRRAYELARQGQLQRAEVLCGEVLQQDTEHAEAWLLRAVIAIQGGNAADSAIAARRSLRANPTRAAAHALLGDALLMLRQPQAALESYQAALLQDAGLVSAHFGRGNACRALQEFDQALASFDEVLRLRPHDAEACVGRGEVLLQMRRAAEAKASFERALVLRPGYAAARRGIGDILLDAGRPEQALTAHQQALQLGADLPDVHNSVGNSLRALGRCAEAVAAYDESLRLDPLNGTIHANRAFALMQLEGRHEEALDGFKRALELDPDIPFAAGSLLYAQISRADWSIRVPAVSREQILRSVSSGKPACLSFAFLSISDCAATQLKCAQVFARRTCSVELPRRHSAGHRQHRPHGHRLRIAYVSADLREHAISYLIVGALERHDRARFETYGISLRPPEPTAAGERIRAAVDRFIDVSNMTDRAAAELMRDLDIDIAVDLNGYTQGSRPRIYAYGAAPIQVSYLGYPGSMGVPFMDYLLADDFVIPPDRCRHYCEAVVHLPECFQANDDKRVISERIFSRAELGIAQDAFVFCCLNNTHKINPPMFDVWMRLLAQLPDSLLWLLCHESEVRDNLCREAASRGIDPRRLLFAERLPYAEHLARLKLADLFLDTLPFNAGTTASDALWAGVPVLTLSGEAFAARMAGSLLRAAGIPELICSSIEEYADKALALARSADTLRRLRARLAQSRGTSPLFDTARFTAHLEDAYEQMWLRLQRGEPPRGFAVPARPKT